MTNCPRARPRTTRATGQRAWLLALAATIAFTAQASTYPQNPLALEGAVYVSHEGVYRFDAGETMPRWRSLDGVETFAPVAHGELLLIGSTRGLYALERATGRVRWHIEPSRTLFSPAIGRDAYAGSLHGELYALRLADGAIRWRRHFDGWIYSPALGIGGESLWSGGRLHALVGLGVADGAERHRVEIRAEAVFSPLDLGDGRVAFNLFDGSTRIVDTASGAILADIGGDAQPSGLERDGESIYRVDRGGRVDIIDAAGLARRRQIDFDTRDLALHPSLDGALLLSDIDRSLWLIGTGEDDAPCRLNPAGRWLKPLQHGAGAIIYFEMGWNPPGLTQVVLSAQCNQNQGSSK